MSTSLENQVRIEKARDEAIERIRAIMLPGAQALCDARELADGYWIERHVKIDGVCLYWRSQGEHYNNGKPSRYGHNKPSVQVATPDDASPELLARVAVVAAETTAQIIRESDAKRAACTSLADALVRDFARVAAGLEVAPS